MKGSGEKQPAERTRHQLLKQPYSVRTIILCVLSDLSFD
jgi:hypothetical protein